MARQEDTCWHCGDRWASEDGPRTALRVIPTAEHAQVGDAPEPGIPAAQAEPLERDRRIHA
jgi:hypothetical protein